MRLIENIGIATIGCPQEIIIDAATELNFIDSYFKINQGCSTGVTLCNGAAIIKIERATTISQNKQVNPFISCIL